MKIGKIASVVKPNILGMPILIPNEKRLRFEIVSISIVSIFWKFCEKDLLEVKITKTMMIAISLINCIT